MAIACPIDLDTLKLRAEIQSIYARVAADPSGEFHFHRGPAYAVTAQLRCGRTLEAASNGHGIIRRCR